MNPKPQVNCTLILGSALVFISVFLAFNSAQTCFGLYSHTLAEATGGVPLILLSIGIVYCAIHKKKMSTVIFFALSLLLSCGYIVGLVLDIIDSRGSTSYYEPALGFYLLLSGQVVMIASFPLHSYFTNKSKPVGGVPL